ncbi:MAG TPA: efflux RND transporter periplasmic adaptor subunit [Chitinophaga sp.]|uniref:efflux RND transporter periplasmic adaptor subunit n=1 Tax=Chitinophaga sp. TaxID=1869181 RepID=UPI002D02687E|nr:efflux RND transporter periplasmic adaptor subunit [Chitinophaga sp.]HVI48612.1 efflux RND transporter periplasmic adaptor subunit [Chitinophaga sp.]
MSYRLPLLPAAISIILLSCQSKQQQSDATGAPPDYPVITLASQSTVMYTDYPASLQGQQNIEIRPKVDGFVAQIYVDEGNAVKRGQLLFRISAPQYEQELRTANAAAKSAEAAVNTAKMQVAKVMPLVKKEIVSNYELEAAQLTLQAQEAALAQAKASVENARINLGYTTIYSPVDGVVGSLPYKLGSLVSSSSPQPLTTVSDISKIYAYFSFNEKQFLDLAGTSTGSVEDKLKKIPPVSLVLANGDGYTEKGHIETAGGLINAGTGAVSLRAAFPNPARLIRSGSSAVIRIEQPVNNAILIPQKATYELQGKRFVYTVDASGTAKNTEVTVMDLSSDESYVVKSGLKAGDRVVINGLNALKDGMKIKPVPATLTNKATAQAR